MTSGRTIVVGPNIDVDALIARRRSLGQDRYDEVWNGDYHMDPGPSGPHAMTDSQLIVLLHPAAKAAGLYATTAFNLGEGPDDYRVPDGGYHRAKPTGTWIPTAAIVIEILSPGDETYAKFEFYADRGVEEILVVDPEERSVRCFVKGYPSSYVESDSSSLLDLSASYMATCIDWG